MLPDDASKKMYFDRSGAPIGLRTWTELRAQPEYRFIARDTVDACGTRHEVVTAWLGTDQGDALRDDAPLIFGTIARNSEDGTWLHDIETFSADEAGARAAHDQMCASLIAGEAPCEAARG